MYIANSFSQDEACLLTVLMESFDDQRFIFHFILIGSGCPEHYLTKGSETMGRLSKTKRHDLLKMSDNHEGPQDCHLIALE